MNAPAVVKNKGSPYSTAERRVPELIPVLCHQPAGDVNHKPGGRLPLLSAKPAVTPTTLKSAATSFTAWWTEAQWVWTVCHDCDLNPGPNCAWVQHANHSATEPPSRQQLISVLELLLTDKHLLSRSHDWTPGQTARRYPLLSTHHSHHPPLPHSFTPGLKPSFSANPSLHSLPLLLQHWLHRLFTNTSEHIHFYPRESFREDYVITYVRLSVCLSVTTITK